MTRTNRSAAVGRRGICSLALAARLAGVGLVSAMGLTVGATASGCGSSVDLSAYREQASELVERFGPELEELSGRVPALIRRAGQLPSTAPGMAELQAQLAENRAEVTALENAIRGLPGKIGSAIKTGKAQAVERTLAAARRELGAALVVLRTELDATASEVARVEAAVRAAKP